MRVGVPLSFSAFQPGGPDNLLSTLTGGHSAFPSRYNSRHGLTALLVRWKQLFGRLDALFLAAIGIAARENGLEKLPGITALLAHDVFRRAGRDDFAAAVAAFGAKVDDPVGGLDDFEIVLDDDDGVAGLDELVQHVEQFCHVVEMQAGGRLVKNVKRAAGGTL